MRLVAPVVPDLLGLCRPRGGIVVEPELVQHVHRFLAGILEVHGHLGLEFPPPHLGHFKGRRRYFCKTKKRGEVHVGKDGTTTGMGAWGRRADCRPDG